MKKIQSILTIALVLFVLTACSKEKRIERSLHKKDGAWSLTTFVIDNYVDNVFSGSDIYSNNGQTMTFTKDGKMVWVWVEDGTTESYNCTWANTETKLTITTPWAEVLIFDIKNRERKSMDLTTTVQSSNVNGGQTVTFKEEYKISLLKQ